MAKHQIRELLVQAGSGVDHGAKLADNLSRNMWNMDGTQFRFLFNQVVKVVKNSKRMGNYVHDSWTYI